VHYRATRTTYDDLGCACTITCATQPLTLLADRWDCALFLDSGGDLWYVPALPNGTWAWENAAEIDSRSEYYHASVIIEHCCTPARTSSPPTSTEPGRFTVGRPRGRPTAFSCSTTRGRRH
jgi:hypothetical protein